MEFTYALQWSWNILCKRRAGFQLQRDPGQAHVKRSRFHLFLTDPKYRSHVVIYNGIKISASWVCVEDLRRWYMRSILREFKSRVLQGWHERQKPCLSRPPLLSCCSSEIWRDAGVWMYPSEMTSLLLLQSYTVRSPGEAVFQHLWKLRHTSPRSKQICFR